MSSSTPVAILREASIYREARGEKKEKTMSDSEDLKGFLEQKFSEVDKRLQQSADSSLKAHEQTRKEVSRLGGMVAHLWEKVEGGEPPGPKRSDSWNQVTGDEIAAYAAGDRSPDLLAGKMTPPRPKKPSLTDEVTDHDLRMHAMHGRLIGLDGNVETIKEDMNILKTQVASKEELAHALKALEIQTRAMGISPKKQGKIDERPTLRRMLDFFMWMAQEREGQKFTLSAFAALTGLVTAMGTTYAIVTGRLPLPNSTAPSHVLHTPYEGPAPASQVAPPLLPTSSSAEKSPSPGGGAKTTSGGGG
jgi:hypothetical protein